MAMIMRLDRLLCKRCLRAAERERTKMAYLQRLQALNTAHLPGDKTKRNGKFKDIEIEISPENVDSGLP